MNAAKKGITNQQIVTALVGHIELNVLWWLLPMHQNGLQHWKLLNKDFSINSTRFKFEAIDWEFDLIGHGLINLLKEDGNPITLTFDSFIQHLTNRLSKGGYFQPAPTNFSSLLNLNQIAERLMVLADEYLSISGLLFLSNNSQNQEYNRFCYTQIKDAYQFNIDRIELAEKYQVSLVNDEIIVSEIEGYVLMSFDAASEMQCAISCIKKMTLNVCGELRKIENYKSWTKKY